MYQQVIQIMTYENKTIKSIENYVGLGVLTTKELQNIEIKKKQAAKTHKTLFKKFLSIFY